MTVGIPTATVLTFLLAMVRVGAWVSISPPFNSKAIPPQVKALFSAAIALAVTPALIGSAPSLETGAVVTAVAEQVLIGAAMGFLTMLVFSTIQAAGDLIDLFGGFSLSSAYDPLMQNQSGVMSRFYNLIAITLLFASDGHDLVLRGFVRTFDVLPLDGHLSLKSMTHFLLDHEHGISAMFVSALQIAGPLVAVLFLADVGLGLLNRVAPSLNAFSLGFPLKIMLTLALLGSTMMLLPDAIGNAGTGLVHDAIEAMVGVARG